jgi:hypothetical protein
MIYAVGPARSRSRRRRARATRRERRRRPGAPGYPIPAETQAEPKWIENSQPNGGSSDDHHMLLVNRDRRILFELYATR